ncbi:unnamed protein product, partial [Scytosiphon promiscuus]
PSQGGVIWPVLLLYPQYGQSDLIQAFRDADMVAEHLAAAFPEEGPPAPWDTSFEYRWAPEKLVFGASLEGVRFV